MQKKCVILPVSAPFHSKLMEPAAEKLAVELDKVVVSDATIPVVTNVTAEALTKSRRYQSKSCKNKLQAL